MYPQFRWVFLNLMTSKFPLAMVIYGDDLANDLVIFFGGCGGSGFAMPRRMNPSRQKNRPSIHQQQDRLQAREMVQLVVVQVLNSGPNGRAW